MLSLLQFRWPERPDRTRIPTWAVATAFALLFSAGQIATAQPAAAPENLRGFLVQVELPIDRDVEERVARAIGRIADESSGSQGRRLLVLQFGGGDQDGVGSRFEQALSLARLLTGPKLAEFQTVAFVPRSLRGHAVLPALACETLIVSSGGTFGEAGLIGEGVVDDDPAVRAAYEDFAERRGTVPGAVAAAMVDPRIRLHRVDGDETEYLVQEEFEKRKNQGEIVAAATVSEAGQLAQFTGRELRLAKLAAYLASDLRTVEHHLKLPPYSLEADPTLGQELRPILGHLRERIDQRRVEQTIRAIEDARGRGVNLIVLEIDSLGGSLSASLQLASFLSELRDVRTVAYVPHAARGDAVLVVLACDHVVLGPEAELGGREGTLPPPREAETARAATAEIAGQAGRSWSVVQAMIEPALAVDVYRHKETGVTALFSPQELDEQVDPELWDEVEPVVAEGEVLEVGVDDARRFGLVRHVASDFEQVKSLYGIDDELATIEPNWGFRVIEWLANPYLAALLLFIGCGALIGEATSPGIGIGGFVAAVCFLLFFWSQVLNGTAGYLEVLLFLGGVLALALEIFVLPGFGVFGFGGILLMTCSIILASQTFVIPRDSADFEQLPTSLGLLAAAVSGAAIGLLVLPRFLPQTPWLGQMFLKPPEGDQLEDLSRRETVIDLAHLNGKHGQTTTRLNPAGKARFGDEIVSVISTGELIDRGAPVRVVEASGNRVLVEPIEGFDTP